MRAAASVSASAIPHKICGVQAAQFQAQRCFYVAQAHREAGNPQAAHGLLSRAQQRAAEAVSLHQECASIDQGALQQLQQLQERAGVWQCVAQVLACFFFASQSTVDAGGHAAVLAHACACQADCISSCSSSASIKVQE